MCLWFILDAVLIKMESRKTDYKVVAWRALVAGEVANKGQVLGVSEGKGNRTF